MVTAAANGTNTLRVLNKHRLLNKRQSCEFWSKLINLGHEINVAF